MFLVLTCSSRRVEHFRFCPDEFQRSDFRISKRKEKKRKRKIYSLTVGSLSVSFRLRQILVFIFLSFIYFYFFILFLSGTHMSHFFHFLVRFSSETNDFVPVSISFFSTFFFLVFFFIFFIYTIGDTKKYIHFFSFSNTSNKFIKIYFHSFFFNFTHCKTLRKIFLLINFFSTFPATGKH